MELKLVKIDVPKDCNVILGMAHFIKTAEDLYEALKNSVPDIKFGIGFCESSGPCLVRCEGNDEELRHVLPLHSSYCIEISVSRLRGDSKTMQREKHG